jgi:hypothetical protein
MSSDAKQDAYYSYLLRVWRVNSQPPRWQMSLRDARTGESFNFADLQQLKNFLDQKIVNCDPQDKLSI